MIKGFSKNKPAISSTLPRPMILFIKSMNKKDLVGAEIGVLNGENSRSILLTLDVKKFYLIDPYEVHNEYLEIKSPVFSTIRKRAEANLEEFNYKITWIRKKSSEAVDDVSDALDFIYIDGNHSYKNCLEDIKNYWPKIKKGGIIGGHDYYNKNEALEVKKAVDEFVEENNLKLNFIREGPLCDWWIVK